MRWLLFSAGALGLMLAGPLFNVATGAVEFGGDWRNAPRTPAGTAPDPATSPEAVVQVYAARAFGWRAAFAVHSWIAVKPQGAARYTVHEVIGWRAYRGLPALAITSGGQLAAEAQAASLPLWRFTFRAQPRAAVGFLFLLPMACVTRLGLMPDPSAELAAALTAMRDQQAHLRAEIPVVHNPAKRMGGQWMGRWVAVYGSDHLAPVARRWKTQIAEIGKAWAQYEELPELDHNSVAGTLQPEELTGHYMLMFLRSSLAHPRNDLRARITRELFMVQGFNTDEYQASGPNVLAHMLTALHFGDYSAFYLAMAYGIDPTPVATIVELKSRLAGAGG